MDKVITFVKDHPYWSVGIGLVLLFLGTTLYLWNTGQPLVS